MAEIKTKATSASVTKFLKSIKPEEKQKDAQALLKMFEKITKEKPVMWGTSIVGFGQYHFKSVSSEGEWFEVGFSPRKQNLTLYILTWNPVASKQKDPELLSKLGKYKRGGGCLYIKHLSDVDQKVLASLIKTIYTHRKKIHK